MRPLCVAVRAVSLALWVLAGLVGCGGPLEDAECQFKKGQYPAAHQALRGLEAESRSWSAATRAEYALYRGLTLIALGDRPRADEWLLEAKAVEDARPGSLAFEDARRLAVAIESNSVP
jgi:hypothetical protein